MDDESLPSSAAFNEELGILLACPISKQLLSEPVLFSDGHYYNKTHLDMWLGQFPGEEARSPMTNEMVAKKYVVEKCMIRNVIQALVEKGALPQDLSQEFMARRRANLTVKKLLCQSKSADGEVAIEACLTLAEWYTTGHMFLPQSESLAYEWYERAVDVASTATAADEEGVEHVNAAAADALYYLGLANALGKGVEQCFSMAVYYYTAAAIDGHRECAILLGDAFQYGLLGLHVDPTLASRWYGSAREVRNVGSTIEAPVE